MVNRLISSLPLLNLQRPLHNRTTSSPFTEPTVALPDDVVIAEFPPRQRPEFLNAAAGVYGSSRRPARTRRI
ncbi:hypothetical protein MTO96_021841 [Rhipicephalus appendiculatus]